jgi:thermostable 8-oxoguanine DNA glycosylase
VAEDVTILHRQHQLIYSIIVAGKSAAFARDAINRLFPRYPPPFKTVRSWIRHDCLEQKLKEARTGNYTKLSKALRQIVSLESLDLTQCSVSDLEAIHGIGPKTARFFVLWTRPDAQCAALDVHILRWLQSLGYDAPRQTPASRKRYHELEEVFLKEAAKRNLSPANLDRKIWDAGVKGVVLEI